MPNKIGGLVPTIQPEPDVSQANGFCKVVDDVKLGTYMKFHNILMTRCKYKSKKFHKYPLKMGFSTPKVYFKKLGSVTFVPLWCPNFMQKLEKTNKQSLRYLKTGQLTDHRQGWWHMTPSDKPGSKIFALSSSTNITDLMGNFLWQMSNIINHLIP